MMLVQAAPKTQPGGVQGAFDRFKYQSVFGPLFMSQLPNANPPKLMNRNKIKYLIFLIITFFLRIQFFLISDLLQHTFDH
jgi:hypothetical protein